MIFPQGKEWIQWVSDSTWRTDINLCRDFKCHVGWEITLFV